MDLTLAIIVTVVGASTPILIAALGELVVERSGVVNLGVEGMMLIGAIAGFVVQFHTGNPYLALLSGAADDSDEGVIIKDPIPISNTRGTAVYSYGCQCICCV